MTCVPIPYKLMVNKTPVAGSLRVQQLSGDNDTQYNRQTCSEQSSGCRLPEGVAILMETTTHTKSADKKDTKGKSTKSDTKGKRTNSAKENDDGQHQEY